jgi:hypothetical protein
MRGQRSDGTDEFGDRRMPPFLRDHRAPADTPPRTDLPRLRPFVITGGRVSAPDPDIDLHTQVVSVLWPRDSRAAMRHEHLAIVELCVEPLSVAEVSARLRLHLRVTRILVSDLRAGGHVEVVTGKTDSTDDADLIHRVINGLRAFG